MYCSKSSTALLSLALLLSSSDAFSIARSTRIGIGTAAKLNSNGLNQVQNNDDFGDPMNAPGAAGGAGAPVDPQAYYAMQLQWQESMKIFAEFQAANPELAANMPPPPPPPPPTAFIGQQQLQPPPAQQFTPPPPQEPQQSPPPTPTPPSVSTPTPTAEEIKSDNPRDYLPKAPSGRNSDSYEVTNSADVYFAQLKRDSQVRLKARREGNVELSNQPFADEGVQKLKELISDDLLAHRRDQAERNGGEFVTSRDEMILPFSDSEDEVADVSSTGISYKDKLAEMRRKRGTSSEGS